ncbi:MAG: phenylalanine--tRNA ligase subunit beta [Planctomycetota bacterium]|jgi:phenylalanyl-tRNA synthetase beta chain
MYTSVSWLNAYLDPPATAEEQAELATRAGFPLEGSEAVEDDVCQDYEMTSNRGDCVCHVGLAREIAAISGRALKVPVGSPSATGEPASDLLSVTNHVHERCPLYTARVIRGISVGPSPEWLQRWLRVRGDIPRNNVVDATNFVQFELGQPTHVFDLAKLAGNEINIRMARPGEAFLPLGEGSTEVKLVDDDLVIADAANAVALAGVKGGALSAVTEGTTDIVLEAATFTPVTVRNTSRRHNIASDSSYRFERGVHPGQVNPSADRLAAVILEIAGGELCAGVVSDGAPIPERRIASMRLERCRALIGMPIEDDQVLDGLARLGFEPRRDADRVTCTVPIHRLDIEREIDLVEEVARMYGLDNIPVADTIRIRIAPPQSTELAKRAVNDTLAGLGYVECVTHSLISDAAAARFLVEGQGPLRVADERAKAEPVLRPSVLPSLLRVRAHNSDAGVADLRLFESASTYWLEGDAHEETIKLGLLVDADADTPDLRELRGAIERLATLLVGPAATVEIEADDALPWLAPGARVLINGRDHGFIGLVAREVAAASGLDLPLACAELSLRDLYASFPPDAEATALPAVPSIERDLTIIVAETTAWGAVRDAVLALDLDLLEGLDFVTTYMGKGVEPGKKSLTLRCRFRAADRTLTHEEVTPQMELVVAALSEAVGGQVRG